MVFNTADDNGLALEIGQNAAEVSVQFFAQHLSRRKGGGPWWKKRYEPIFWRAIAAWGEDAQL